MEVREDLPKCLLVDDLEENLFALEGLLAQEEVEVVKARSGIEALELLLKHDFALSLIDVHMPEMDGFELAETMRSTEKTRAVPIIFVTAAEADAQRIFEGYEAGAVDFLQKPLNSHIVLSKARVFLELYNQKIQLQQKIEKLRQTESRLHTAIKSRDEFLSICSHELKTPLTSLKMQIQMTERQRQKLGGKEALCPPIMEKFIEQAGRSVERIIHLVNDMLDISRATTGKLSLQIEEVGLTELTSDVIDRLRPLMETASIKLILDLQKDVKIMGDKFRIEQVLINLLINAAKYAPDAPVNVSVKKKEDMASVTVSDQGRGITAEDQKRIFERFERAVSPNSVSGMGLGLFICKEIIDMHGGTISVFSELGKGSTFEVKLPLP